MTDVSLVRRFMAGVYEALLLAAVLFVAAFLFVAVFGSALEFPRRFFLQSWLLAVLATYFGWFWVHGGQTLAMKTWHLRVVALNSGKITLKVALLRFVLAAMGFAFFGVGWWWMLLDREHCTLHDRLAGTRLIRD